MPLYRVPMHSTNVHYASHMEYTAKRAKTAGCPSFLSLHAFMCYRPPEPRWIIRGLLPEGVIILAGRGCSGKSSLALGLSLSVAFGGLALSRFPSVQGSVLYLALEENEWHMKEKVTRLLQAQPVPRNFTLALNWPSLENGGLADLEDTIEEHYEQAPIRLVVIDPLSQVVPSHRTIGNTPGRHGGHAGTDTFFLPLQEMARHYHLAIVLVQHQSDETKTQEANCRMTLTREAEQRPALLHIAGQSMEERKIRITFDPLRSL